MRRRTRDERGAVAVLTALVAVGLLLTASFVVDLGLGWDARGQAQNAADASALAAGNVLYDEADTPDVDAAVAAAMRYAEENFDVTAAEWAGCTDPGRLAHAPASPCISFDEQARPRLVRVRIPNRTMQTVLAGLAGVNELTVSASAIASLDPGAVVRCSLCVLGSGAHVAGNGNVTVSDSSVHFNGSVTTGPNGEVSVTAVGSQITVEGSAAGSFSPSARTGAPHIGDPLQHLVLPSAFAGLPRKQNPCVDGPGVYGAYDFGSGACALKPGLYVITGAWRLGNNTTLTGSGLTVYATCGTPAEPRPCAAAGEVGGAFDAKNGNVSISGSAPALPGVVIAYDRNNASDVSVQGNGDTNIVGTIYAARSRLYANGNSGNGVSNGSIVVDTIYLNGQNSELKLKQGLEREWRLPPGGLRLSQ